MLELGDKIRPPNGTPASSPSVFSPSSGFGLPWKPLPAWHGPVPENSALILLQAQSALLLRLPMGLVLQATSLPSNPSL